MKKLKYIFAFLLLFVFIPFVKAENNLYDKVVEVTKVKTEDKVDIYFFYSDTCPHCHKEMEYLKEINDDKYKNKINIIYYEVSSDGVIDMLGKVKDIFSVKSNGVPFTVVEDEYLLGFSDSLSSRLDYMIDSHLDSNTSEEKTYNIPIIGKVNAKDASLSLIAVILGFIDGFNPCAMWILLLLINMSLSVNKRKKMIIVGFTFIFTSGLVYFLSMLGIGIFIDMAMVSIIRDIIAVVAIALGIYNLYVFYKTRKDKGCHVVKDKKRKSIIAKITNILDSKGFLLGVFGTIVLAISVNLVELACSLGFPTIFLELLSINKVAFVSKILYLLLYILFYLIDDIVIFLIAVFTLKSKGISTKYNKFVNLVGGILMILMGLLLIFKPEWIMFNF